MKPSLRNRIEVTKKPDGSNHVMYQTWNDLLFLHWEIEPELIQKTLPKGLKVDTYEDKAYLGIVPFFMNSIRPRFCPCLPKISFFMELNLRTYVYDENGVPGVWFYSLDANSKIAVRIARKLFHLPYHDASMSSQRDKDSSTIFYSSNRVKDNKLHKSNFTYKQKDLLPAVNPNSLDFFLIERYILFSYNPKLQRLYSGRVHHEPYPLFEVDVPQLNESIFELNGFTPTSKKPDHAVMSKGVSVMIYPLRGE